MKNTFLLTFLLFVNVILFAKSNNKAYTQYGFIENKGQINNQNGEFNSLVKFLWCSNDYNIQLKNNCFSYEALKRKSDLTIANTQNKHIKTLQSKIFDSVKVHRIDVSFVGSNSSPKIITERCSNEYLNFFNNNISKNEIFYVHYYSKIIYKNIYPNIDIEFISDSISPNGFKYNFIVHPNGNINDIIIQYSGSNSTNINSKGSIIINTDCGEIEENIPVSYDIETNELINVKYKKLDDSTFNFVVSDYNHNHNLLIDPWATYYGWSGGVSQVNSIANDNLKNSIVVGQTNILTNIATSGAHQVIYGGGSWDAFIRKFNSLGFPIWTTYYGGGASDKGIAISTNIANDIVIVGETQSSNNISTPNSFQPTIPSSGIPSFIATFNSSGIRQWASYYPASLWSVAYDNQNNVIVAGITDGDTGIATIGAHQTSLGGDFDCVVTKFNSSGVRQWSTYYGGNDKETNDYISVDNNNNIVLSGITMSSNNISSNGAYQQNLGGSYDLFIAKFNSFGIREWGTYYGSSGNDEGIVCNAVDANGNIFVTGVAGDNAFFATNGAFQATPGFSFEFLAKFNSFGIRQWSTYFGGNNEEYIYGIACDKLNNIVFVGQTKSTNIISSLNAYQTNNIGDFDAFIEKFNTNGLRLWGTYFGGSASEIAAGVSIDTSNNIYITGNTSSTTNITTPNAYQNSMIGSSDAFIACFDSTGHFTTGIEEVNLIKSLIKVYPNPTKDKITVSIKEYASKGGSISVQSIDGKLFKKLIVKAEETTVNINDLPAGVYLLQYDDGEVCETVKVVKE